MTGPADDLDRILAEARDELDAEIAASGAVARVTAAALADLRPRWRVSLVALAATLLIAAAIGGLVDFGLWRARPPAPVEVVVLDPLIFGPLEVDRP